MPASGPFGKVLQVTQGGTTQQKLISHTPFLAIARKRIEAFRVHTYSVDRLYSFFSHSFAPAFPSILFILVTLCLSFTSDAGLDPLGIKIKNFFTDFKQLFIMYAHYIPLLSAESPSLGGLSMSQRPPSAPRVPPRASRHRSSVIGPPPGIEAGTGYISPQTSPTAHQFPRPPPRARPPTTPSTIPVTSGSSSTFRRNAQRTDPERFDPIMEEPPTPPARSWRRPRQRDTGSSDVPTVMFYPSTTTVSSMESNASAEPMPFFRTGLRMPTPGSGSIPTTPEEARDHSGTNSVHSVKRSPWRGNNGRC